MFLTSYGAAGEVTGSKHILEIEDKKILFDCGFFQGPSKDHYDRNKILPFDPKSIDLVILSHGHLDHCGSLPTLVKNGFKGKIYCTPATKDVTQLILEDAVKIQEQDIKYLNRHLRKGQTRLRPQYNSRDVASVIRQTVTVPYFQEKKILPNITLQFFDAGHILGSAISYLKINSDSKTVRFAYTGDLGQKNMAILRDPSLLPETDILLCESTYGGRHHEDFRIREAKLKKIIQDSAKSGGKVFVPSFALERMQTLVYNLHKLTDSGQIPKIPIYVDSPLAVDLTEVFSKHTECFDEETKQMFIQRGEDPFGFKNLTYVSEAEDSKKLNTKSGPMVILATSGMMEAGRILHHLKNGLPDPKNTLLIVGYLAEGTMGREILEGAKFVNIFGERIEVNARIEKINAFSAHADEDGLESIVKQTPSLKKVILVHGDEESRNNLGENLSKIMSEITVLKPDFGVRYLL